MPVHNIFRTSGGFSRFLNLFSGEDDGSGFGATGPYLFYPGRALTIHTGTIARATAPGASATVRMECVNGTEGGTQTGADVDLVDPDTSVRTAISGSWTASTDSTTGQGKHIVISAGAGSPALDDSNFSILYDDASDETISYYGFGDRVANLLAGVGAGADRYTSFGVSDAVASTESFVQLPWPINGTFQHVSFVYAKTGGDDVTLVLQIDGSDTPITFTLADTSGSFTLTTNSVLTASVSAGELVSWRIRQGSPVAGTFACTLMCGFIAD